MAGCNFNKMFEPWIAVSDTCADVVLEKTVHIGQKLYIVAQYHSSKPFEVIDGTVTVMRYDPKTGKKYFTVEGRWDNGNWYNATFRGSSLTKKVFYTKVEAECDATKKNNRSANVGR